MKSRPHDEVMAEIFRADPDYASELLSDVRRDGDQAELAILLQQRAKAFGQDARRKLHATKPKRHSRGRT